MEEGGAAAVKHGDARLELLVVCAALAVFFSLLFYTDNKYETPPPYGASGVITLGERHLDRARPLYLIDGWLLTDARVTAQPTYIGEFSSLQRGDLTVSPHGRATYQLTLRYDGPPRVAAVLFPKLSTRYSLSLDGVVLATGMGNGQISFLLEPGDHLLSVETVSRVGYYSGMYYPPALGTPETLARVSQVRSFAYALALLVPLALALFTLLLWRTGDGRSRWFGGLCLCYALYVSRYFVSLFALPFAPYWFFVENLSLYGLCFCAVRLTALAAEAERGMVCRRFCQVLLAVPGALLGLCLLIPVVPWAVTVHGMGTDLYYVLVFCALALFAVKGGVGDGWERRYILAGCASFGVGLLLNLFASNRFEPIYFFWQFEWCGLFLVALFGAMMAARNRRILEENEILTGHLEEQVVLRTRELTQLLDERKAFFSDMAHDLKAPVFATQSFIAAIRTGGVGVDGELLGYLDQAEEKQRELAKRLQGLSTINALDKIEGERVPISLRALLEEVYAAHRGEAEVVSVHLELELPQEDATLRAQPEKLEILFENLIYNALRATPPEGHITVSAQVDAGAVHLAVADTGCGIPAEELPYVFRRFFVGRQNKVTGTGLGLYIVKAIVTELSGSISVTSTPGEGTTFRIQLPAEGCGPQGHGA